MTFNTKDDDKKPRDKNAERAKRNDLKKVNAEHGKHQYSKKTDHL